MSARRIFGHHLRVIGVFLFLFVVVGNVSYIHSFLRPAFLPLPFSFHAEWHPLSREDRFPSVEDRVKIYMHRWYAVGLCHNFTLPNIQYSRNEDGPYPTLQVHNTSNDEEALFLGLVQPDSKLLLNRPVVDDCADSRGGESPHVHQRGSMRSYCQNVQDLMDINDQFDTPLSRRTPLVAHFGDVAVNDDSVPMIGKWRNAMTRQELQDLTSQCPDNNELISAIPTGSIIWKLETIRHWEPLEDSRSCDRAWEQKKPLAIWRGAFTGKGHAPSDLPPLQHCRENQRCRFVLEHMNSKLIDAGIDDTVGLIPDTVNGVKLTKERLSMGEFQSYKILISFEGNDVASGLKWNLLSKSVVLMPKPTRTSWAMEELLEPWVHYIPMDVDGANAEEMVQWVRDNDQKARQISERATLFMYDLLYHPDAQRDERQVKEEIVRRYQEFWY